MLLYIVLACFTLDLYLVIICTLHCLWVIDTWFVYFNHRFASCTVLFSQIVYPFYVQTVFDERAMCSLEK